jgi:NTE family protein
LIQQSLGRLRQSSAFAGNKDPLVAEELQGPDIGIYAVDVSFAALKDAAEFQYLNELPTTFVLPDEAVDRLRTAAGVLIRESPEFKRLLKDVGAQIVPTESPSATTKPGVRDAAPPAR